MENGKGKMGYGSWEMGNGRWNIENDSAPSLYSFFLILSSLFFIPCSLFLFPIPHSPSYILHPLSMAVVEQIFPSLTWRIRHLSMYPDHPFDFVKLDNDFDGIHFGIYEDHELIGVVSLFITGQTGQFRKLAILPEAQGKGFGLQLMRYLIDFCETQNLKKLWCNARTNAKEFYFKLGFEATNQTYTADGFDFVIMEKSLIN